MTIKSDLPINTIHCQINNPKHDSVAYKSSSMAVLPDSRSRLSARLGQNGFHFLLADRIGQFHPDFRQSMLASGVSIINFFRAADFIKSSKSGSDRLQWNSPQSSFLISLNIQQSTSV